MWWISLFYFFLRTWRFSYFATSFSIFGNSFPALRRKFSSSVKAALAWKLSLSRCALEASEDLQPVYTWFFFLCERALLRWGLKSFHRISYTTLQYQVLPLIDIPSSAGSLNESPLVDRFGSIKTVSSRHTTIIKTTNHYQELAWILAHPYPLPTSRPEYLFHVTAYSHSKL